MYTEKSLQDLTVACVSVWSCMRGCRDDQSLEVTAEGVAPFVEVAEI